MSEKNKYERISKATNFNISMVETIIKEYQKVLLSDLLENNSVEIPMLGTININSIKPKVLISPHKKEFFRDWSFMPSIKLHPDIRREIIEYIKVVRSDK